MVVDGPLVVMVETRPHYGPTDVCSKATDGPHPGGRPPRSAEGPVFFPRIGYITASAIFTLQVWRKEGYSSRGLDRALSHFLGAWLFYHWSWPVAPVLSSFLFRKEHRECTTGCWLVYRWSRAWFVGRSQRWVFRLWQPSARGGRPI